MNNVQIYGRLVNEPELRAVGTTTVTTFTIAVDRKMTKEQKEEAESNNKPTADFIRVKAWKKLGELIKNYSAKGKRVNVVGRIETGSYDKDGQKFYTTEVVASEIDIIDWRDSTGTQEDYSDDFEPAGDFVPQQGRNGRVPF